MTDRARWIPWLLSIALHALVIVASLFVVWTVLPAPEEPREPVTLDFDAPAPAPELAAPDDASRAEASPPPLPEAPPPPAAALPRAAPAPVAEAAPRPASPPPAPERAVTFVTAGASSAREIVYVVDASGSAITAFPDIVERLRDSLTALHPSQRFQVILLRRTNGRPFDFVRTPPATQAPIPIDALPENVSATLEWLEKVVPGGPSDLPAALLAAAETRADAIFILARVTEADAPVRSASDLFAELDRLDPDRRTTIRAMQMFEPDPTGLLRALARDRGGPAAYSVVTLNDLQRPDRP